jgi:hypothetical protein
MLSLSLPKPSATEEHSTLDEKEEAAFPGSSPRKSVQLRKKSEKAAAELAATQAAAAAAQAEADKGQRSAWTRSKPRR